MLPRVLIALAAAAMLLVRAGYSSLAEGAKVSFDIVANRGKGLAENLKLG
jgi:cold shock CspA family protein